MMDRERIEHLNSDDELKWLRQMKRQGSLNPRGLENLKIAEKLREKRGRNDD